MREKKALSTAIMLLLVSVSLLFFSSGFISLSTKKFDYALWCTYSDLSPEFLERLNLGRIDILVINSASVKTDNTITYSFTREQLDGFMSQVRAVNPNMKFYADIYSYRDFPDKSTPEKRQVIIDETVAFIDYFGNRFDAIIDDTEKYVGTTADHLQYFSECSEVVETLGVPYYPWIYYKYLPSTLATRCAVGLYGSHAYYETEWKSALERVQTDANSEICSKDGYMIWLIAEHYSDYSTIREQLAFLEQEIAEKGISLYSKMESVGIWWYRSMTADDWDAWIAWVN